MENAPLWRRLITLTGFKLGLILTLLFCLFKIGTFPDHDTGIFGFVQKLDNTVTDAKFLIRGGPDTKEEKAEFQKNAHVVIVAIDEKSQRMEDLGLWPWPRVKTAALIEQLEKCGARVIGFDVVFAEPDVSRIAPVVQSIKERYDRVGKKDEEFENDLEKVLDQVQGDRKLARVLEENDNVVLGYFFFLNKDEIDDLKDAQDGRESIGFGTISYVVKYHPSGGASVPPAADDTARWFTRALGVRANLPILSEAAERFGFFNVLPDPDRIYRRVPLVIGFEGNLFPSISLEVLSVYFGQPVELLLNTFTREEFVPGYVGLFLGPLGMPGPNHVEIPTERKGFFRVNYYGGPNTFRHVSAGDIIHGDEESCRATNGKIVLVGATTVGIYDLRPMPFDHSFPGVEIHASVIENVVTGSFLTRPPVLPLIEAGFILVMGVFLSWFLNRFRLTLGLLVALVVFVGVALGDYLLLFRNGFQGYIVIPEIQNVVLFLGIAVFRYMTEEREKSKIRHAFQFYLSKDVIDIVVKDTSKLKLGGERRELTVLFSDIRGFTTVSERLAPEALTELLNEYLTPMTELVFKHSGTLDKYMGDAIMAFFGAPVPFPFHARAACETALDMIQELARLCEGWRQRGLPALDIGIGINTGPMSVGNMGSKSRFDYTVLGDNVNLGSRLEGLNKQYGTHIVISQFTHSAVKDDFTCRELDAVVVKGKQEPVRVFELLHRGPLNPRDDAWLLDYREALTAYQGRQWDTALERFGQLSQSLPNDGVCRMYRERCQKMKASPPGPDWDGVFKMTTK